MALMKWLEPLVRSLSLLFVRNFNPEPYNIAPENNLRAEFKLKNGVVHAVFKPQISSKVTLQLFYAMYE